jgi:[ribosomal protein S5]-alanine N-acetyltransferase
LLDQNFDPFPILETQRLTLRKITMTDAADIYAIRHDPETMRYIGRPLLSSIAEAQQLIGEFQQGIRDQKNIVWGITLKDRPDLIGTIGFRTIDTVNRRGEIGYVLKPDFWRNGYASEAVASIIKYGFSVIGLHSIEARVNPANKSSSKVLLNQNFVQEAYFQQDTFFDGIFYDTEVYSLLNPK